MGGTVECGRACGADSDDGCDADGDAGAGDDDGDRASSGVAALALLGWYFA